MSKYKLGGLAFGSLLPDISSRLLRVHAHCQNDSNNSDKCSNGNHSNSKSSSNINTRNSVCVIFLERTTSSNSNKRIVIVE